MIQIEDLPVIPLPDKVDTGDKAWDALKGLSFDELIAMISKGIVEFTFRLIGAILIFYVGKFIIKKLYGFVQRLLDEKNVDASLHTFLLSLVKITLYFILIISVVGILGIETSSFFALFATASLAISMALSGTLQNFAGGVLILFLKPYRVGDFIETQGYTGIVKEIQIFHTVINTPDNKTIIIPNGGLSTGTINNYSLENYRRVDWTIGLCYGCDAQRAKETIVNILLSDDRVVADTLLKDMEKRRQAMLDSIPEDENDCPEDNPDCEEEKQSFWQRLIHRRKKRHEILKQKIIKQTTINPVIEDKLNISRPPFVSITELADSSVNFVVRAWTHQSNYWDLYFAMNERFYNELPKHGFDFPFPQMDIHIADVAQPLLVR